MLGKNRLPSVWWVTCTGVPPCFGDLPDVVDALHHLGAAELDVFFIVGSIGDEIDLAIGPIHGPVEIALVIAFAQLGEGACRPRP